MNQVLKNIEKEVEGLPEIDLKNFLGHYSSILGEHNYAQNTLKDPEDGVPYLRKVLASALSVVNNLGRHVGQKIGTYITIIIGYVNQHGFSGMYTRQDIKMIYAYKKLYRLYQ